MANDPDKVKVGAGILWVGPVGVLEPNDLTTPWGTVDPDWLALGYTEEGHEFSTEPTFEPVEVAEELEPIRYEQNANASRLAFAAAEMTARNLSLAYNGGTITTLNGTVVKFEPPEIGDVTRAAFGWESNDGTQRRVFRKCLQTGNVATAWRKSPTKALIPMEFRLETVGGGLRPWIAIMDEA